MDIYENSETTLTYSVWKLLKHWSICYYYPHSDSIVKVVLFLELFVCGCVGLFVNAITRTIWDIIMNFLWEQDMVKSSDEFENGCIPMYCG